MMGKVGMERLMALNKTRAHLSGWSGRQILQGKFILKKGLYCLSGDQPLNNFLKPSLERVFILYNNFIVQHSFINQGLLTDQQRVAN
jgi:hypothetical protein